MGARKLVSTKALPYEEWLKCRKQGLGGSDAGAVCGLNPYRTAMQVYLDKRTEETEAIDNEAMRLGRDLEQYVAQRFMEATGKKVRRANYMYQSMEHPFMLADVDRLVVGENAGLECKTVSPFLADKWKDGQIPLSYQLQCYHYMAVMDADAWYIAALIYGREFQYHRIERDEEVIADLIQIEEDFWENYVLEQRMPEPDGSKKADEFIAEYFKESVAKTIPLDGFDEKLKRRQELEEQIDRMDTEKKQIEQELKLYLGEAEIAENQNYRVSWRSVCSNRVDASKLKSEKPEIYQQYLKPIQFRRFTVQAA